MLKKMSFLVAAVLALVWLGMEAPKEPPTVRITAVGWNIAAASFEEQARLFEKLHPNIKVDVRYVDQDYTRIMPRLAAGTEVPDVMMVHNRDLITFVHKYPGMLRDITTEVTPIKDNFVAAAWDAVTVDGHIYGIPTDLGPAALFYREDLWRAADLDPQSIETWDDLIRAGKKLSRHFHAKVTMLGMCEDTDFYDQILNELGGNYVSPDDRTIVINSFEAKQAMHIVQRMLEEGTLKNVKDWDGLMTAIEQGEIAAVAYGVWFAGTLSYAAPEQRGKWKVMPLPAITRGGSHAANSGGSVAVLANHSRHPQEAWEFLHFCLNTPEGELAQLRLGLFPAYKPLYHTPEFESVDPFIGLSVNKRFAQDLDKLKPLRRGPITLDYGRAIREMMATVVAGGDPDSALDKAAADIATVTGLAVQ